MTNDVDKQLEQIKEFYDNLTDEEFKQRLINAGFKFDETIPGQIIFTEKDRRGSYMKDIDKIMDNYLATVTPEQFDKDLIKAGIENCPISTPELELLQEKCDKLYSEGLALGDKADKAFILYIQYKQEASRKQEEYLQAFKEYMVKIGEQTWTINC